jgi:drug/metabolite transporter (DMT)-like permease
LSSKRGLSVIEGALAGILFGSAAVLIRFISLDAVSIAFWRLVIASAALLAGAKIMGYSLGFDRKNLVPILLLGALLAIHFILFIASVKETTILNATVLVNTSPLQAVAIAALIYHAKPNPKQSLGLAMAFAGVVLIALADLSQFKQGSIIGDVLAMLAATSEAFYLNIGRRVRRQMQAIKTMLPVFAAAALFTMLFSIVIAGAPSLPAELGSIIPLLGLGLIPTALGHTLYFSSLLHLKAFETATLALIEPLGAAALGFVVFFEVPGLIFSGAAMMVLIGVAIVIYYAR